MKNRIEEYRKMIECKKIDLEKEEARLRADDRRDESVFAKIQGNICDVFLACFRVVCQRNHLTEDSIESIYEKVKLDHLAQFDKIPMAWKNRLELAKKNDDLETVAIEEKKLEIADWIRSEFLRIWEERQ